jgi:hypothetical protein
MLFIVSKQCANLMTTLKVFYGQTCLKGILSTKIVIFSYPKLLSFSILTFIKWRLTLSYAAKDTIFWQKRPKTIVNRIIVLDDNILNLFIRSSMWTRLEHAHCALPWVRSNDPTDPLHISCIWKILHFYSWIRQSPLSSTRWHFLFCPRTTCYLLFLNSANAQDGFT